MSFAIYQYQHILAAAEADWLEARLAEQAVTEMFQSMQDDPHHFADLQRAKYIMGLGHPICGHVFRAGGTRRTRLASVRTPM